MGEPRRDGQAARHLGRGGAARQEAGLEEQGGRRDAQLLLDQAGGQHAGVGDEHAVRLPGEPGERLVLAGDHRPAPPGHHHPAPEGVPEVRVGQHPADLGGRDERAELDPEGVCAVAVGFRGGQGDPVPAGVERGPEPDVREDVPVGAQGRQDDVHAVGSVGGDGFGPLILMRPKGRSGDDFLRHLAVNIGQAVVAARVAVGQLFVVEPQQVQDGGVQVVDVDPLLDGVPANSSVAPCAMPPRTPPPASHIVKP